MQLDSLYSENRTEEMFLLNEWFLSNDIFKNEKLELKLFYSNDFNLQRDSISCACYVCLYSFHASKLSDKIVNKQQWNEKFNELLEVDIEKFRIRLEKSYIDETRHHEIKYQFNFIKF